MSDACNASGVHAIRQGCMQYVTSASYAIRQGCMQYVVSASYAVHQGCVQYMSGAYQAGGACCQCLAGSNSNSNSYHKGVLARARYVWSKSELARQTCSAARKEFDCCFACDVRHPLEG